MTQEELNVVIEADSKWACSVCRATMEIKPGPPLEQHISYPAATGPYSYSQKAHDCPVRKGLLAVDMELHPNAVKQG